MLVVAHHSFSSDFGVVRIDLVCFIFLVHYPYILTIPSMLLMHQPRLTLTPLVHFFRAISTPSSLPCLAGFSLLFRSCTRHWPPNCPCHPGLCSFFELPLWITSWSMLSKHENGEMMLTSCPTLADPALYFVPGWG
jgi:hypothetical protein